MKFVRYLIAALVLTAAGAAIPQAAQAQCTVKCSCIRGGCGCQAGGGNGLSCTSEGGDCFVSNCGSPIRPVAFAPDGGTLVAPAEAAPAVGVLAAFSPRRPDAVSLGTASWESVAPGHAVARGCNDVILAHWYAPEAASAVRESSRSVLL